MKTYAVYLLNRRKPYIVKGESSISVSIRWEAHYKETPIKVIPVKFNHETGEYDPIEQ